MEGARQAAPAGRPLLLGHRGARLVAPENSIAAFEGTLDHGCDGFEFDVRCTADARTIVCHDPVLAGYTVAQARYEQFGALANNPPCLEDVLQRFGSRAFLDIEVKVSGMEEAVVSALDRFKPTAGCCVSSFLPEVIEEMRVRAPSVPLGYICDDRRKLGRWEQLPVDYLVPQHKLVTPALVREAHDAGVKFLVWTINGATAMREMAAMGVDGIISDDTALLARTFVTR